MIKLFRNVRQKLLSENKLNKYLAYAFDEIAKMSHDHGKQMFEQKDEAHLEAMQEMRVLMQEPEAMQQWMDSKHKEFEELPE